MGLLPRIDAYSATAGTWSHRSHCIPRWRRCQTSSAIACPSGSASRRRRRSLPGERDRRTRRMSGADSTVERRRSPNGISTLSCAESVGAEASSPAESAVRQSATRAISIAATAMPIAPNASGLHGSGPRGRPIVRDVHHSRTTAVFTAAPATIKLRLTRRNANTAQIS